MTIKQRLLLIRLRLVLLAVFSILYVLDHLLGWIKHEKKSVPDFRAESNDALERFKSKEERSIFYRTFVVCPICGNKRCPKAEDSKFKCTNSNELNQVGEIE
jgi:hypothetical protein